MWANIRERTHVVTLVVLGCWTVLPGIVTVKLGISIYQPVDWNVPGSYKPVPYLSFILRSFSRCDHVTQGSSCQVCASTSSSQEGAVSLGTFKSIHEYGLYGWTQWSSTKYLSTADAWRFWCTHAWLRGMHHVQQWALNILWWSHENAKCKKPEKPHWVTSLFILKHGKERRAKPFCNAAMWLQVLPRLLLQKLSAMRNTC